MVDEKTPLQKVVTDWIFNQSAGLVLSIFTIGIGLYHNHQLSEQIKVLDAVVKDLLIYERDKMGKTVEDNTKALEYYRNYHQH